MTSVLAPVKTITLQGLAPDVIQSCVLAPAPPTPDPEPADAIYAPVAPGITYAGLPVVPAVVDTSPDQIIGCCNDVGTDPQGRLNALFPAAISGDGVVDRASNDIWVFDGATWNNVGPTPGPTLTVTSTIPPWNEIVVYDARVRTRLEVNGLAYALELLTEPAAYGITLGLTVRSVTALVAVPTANSTLAAGLPAVIAENPILVPVANLTATANAPAISSGASVEVPSRSITLNGIIPAQVGILNAIIAVPSQTIPADLHAPQVSTGSSVSVPVSNANLTAYAPTVFDDDAWTYILAVESADTEALEDGVRIAINTFVVGCKSDGIWNAIKSSCILAGARTLTGALVPLKGTAPTSFNFAGTDYSRTTGLLGNGTNKYLDTNRLVTADPQNNCHIAAYVDSASDVPVSLGSSGLSNTGATVLVHRNPVEGRLRCTNYKTGSINAAPPGFAGFSRSSSANFTAQSKGASETIVETSSAYTVGGDYVVHRFQNFYFSSRISFYSIGESLDLSLLDFRVTQLLADIDAAV